MDLNIALRVEHEQQLGHKGSGTRENAPETSNGGRGRGRSRGRGRGRGAKISKYINYG